MRAWEDFLKKQEDTLGSHTIEKWLRPFKVIRFDAGNLYLEAPDSFKAVWFEEHIRPQITPALITSNNKKIKVHLSCVTQNTMTHEKAKVSKATSFGKNFSLTFDEINPDCTFTNFVTTEDNLLAYKLLTMAAGLSHESLQPLPETNELPTFNPIYLTGRAGSGKSHLMMACAGYLKERGKKVIYVRAETFTEHVVDAIRSGEMREFRQGYRFVDTLIIDDIEILSRKSATQEEFFHTFNALHLDGKQIILSSKLAPSALKFIEPRLVSRFEWGIVVPLQHLALEEMKKALLAKSTRAEFPLSDEVASFLLENFTSNLKNLLRAFDALILRTHLNLEQTSLPLSLEKAQSYLSDLIQEEEKATLTPSKIIRTVAEHYNISSDDILSKSQNRECALPRQIAMHLCRHRLNMPFMKIGELFRRDHSTVMTSVKQVQKNLEGKHQEIISSLSTILKRLEL